MMKQKILIVLGIFLTCSAFSQDNNKSLSGKIIAPNLQESTVHIINKTQKTGTLNTVSGQFNILVRENDTLLFSSIQYNKLEIIVTTEILQRENFTVELTEDVNELTTVNISDHDLTGNLNVDLTNIKVVKDLPVNLTFRDLEKKSLFESDRKEHPDTPVNIAAQQNEIGYGAAGLNILGGLGLLADLVGIKSKPTPVYVPPVVPSVQIRKLFDDEFFKNSLGIKEENIGDFIFYLDDVGLSQQLFKPEKRMALIEVLIGHGKVYNERISSKN